MSALNKARKIVDILPDWAVIKYIKHQIIRIDPLKPSWKKHVDPVSIDFNLGSNLRIFTSDNLNTIGTLNASKIEME